MKFPLLVLALLLSFSLHAIGQSVDMKLYESGWTGRFENPQAFNFIASISKLKGNHYSLQIANYQVVWNWNFNLRTDNTFKIQLDSNFSFIGYVDINKGFISGFIENEFIKSHIQLNSTNKNTYQGNWNLLLVDDLSDELFLNIENTNGQSYEAYTVFGDGRIPRLSNYDFKKSGDSIFFKEARTGLLFSAKLDTQKFVLQVRFLGKQITHLEVKRHPEYWTATNHYVKPSFDGREPSILKDGWLVSNTRKAGLLDQPLEKMIDSINANKITNTHAVLIARNGKLVFEKYFNGFNARIPHDMRSASKSISSAIIGIAIDKGLLKNVQSKLYDYLPSRYTYTKMDDVRKPRINIHSLLTMSSGLNAIDFGVKGLTPAAEDVYQQTNDWAKTVLEAPMINEPGTHANYGSANPYLLGLVIDSIVKEPLQLFMDKNLFSPLGITNYIIQNDDEGKPYFGGGMYMTPRDMLKFGQLYLNKGKWNKQKVISSEWINRSFGKYLILENHPQKNEYGYLWWHHRYKAGEEIVESIEARGAGGQYIFIIPKFDLVVVVTSGNFRNGRVWQPEKIVESYILPALVSK